MRENNLAVDNQSTSTVVLESLTDGLHVIDSTWRLTKFNAEAKRLFAAQGIDADTLVGKRLFDEALPEARDTEAGRALIAAMVERRSTTVEAFYPPWKRWFAVRHPPQGVFPSW